MSMVVRIFGQMLFYKHFVRGYFMSMVVRIFDQRLFHEHDSANIRPEALS